MGRQAGTVGDSCAEFNPQIWKQLKDRRLPNDAVTVSS
jgi:hypothetical protein